MRRITKVFAILIAFAGVSGPAAAQAVIGSVVRCAGTCVGVSEGRSESLTSGSVVHLNEKLTTDVGARLEVAFDDGTRVTLGEKAELVLDDFVYRPSGASRFHAAASGSFRYISGKLGPGASRVATVTTPVALIGVRGTDFWGGTLSGVSGVVVFTGSVSVTTAAGTVILSGPGEGTDLSDASVAPSPASQWSQARIAAALASVAFP